MTDEIYALATVIYGSVYADLLADDIADYSEIYKQDVLASLREQARERVFTLEQRQWLLGNTNY